MKASNRSDAARPASPPAVLLLAGLLLLGVLLPSPARAQAPQAADTHPADTQAVAPDHSRAEAWREIRRRKAEGALPAPEPGFFQRTVRWAQRKMEGGVGGSDGPPESTQLVFGGLRDGEGFALGVRFDPTRARDDVLGSVEGHVSHKQYWGVLGLLGFEWDRVVGYGYLRYRHMPQEDFYGLGQHTNPDDHTDYRLNDLIGGALVGVRPTPRLFVGSHLSYLVNRIGRGHDGQVPDVRQRFSETGLPGLHADLDYLVLGVWGEYDGRDAPAPHGYGSRFAPTSRNLRGLSLDATHGTYLSAEVVRYGCFEGGTFGFTQIDLEAQHFVSIRDGFQVVALRTFTSFRPTNGSHEVPFYLMQTLGGSRSLRGYPTDRFTDRHVALLNAEFRWQAWWWLQMAAFVDAGQVFPEVDAFRLDRILTSYGVGMRFGTTERVFVRADVAASAEGVQLLLKFGSFL